VVDGPMESSLAAPAGDIQPSAPAAGSTDAFTHLDAESRVAWATGMATAAVELARGMEDLPPSEKRLHQQRLNALNIMSARLAGGTAAEPANPPPDSPFNVNTARTPSPALASAGPA